MLSVLILRPGKSICPCFLNGNDFIRMIHFLFQTMTIDVTNFVLFAGITMISVNLRRKF